MVAALLEPGVISIRWGRGGRYRSGYGAANRCAEPPFLSFIKAASAMLSSVDHVAVGRRGRLGEVAARGIQRAIAKS